MNICCFCQFSTPSPGLDNSPLIFQGSAHPHPVPSRCNDQTMDLRTKRQIGISPHLYYHLPRPDRSPRNLVQGQDMVVAESFDYKSPKTLPLLPHPDPCHYLASLSVEVWLCFHFLGIGSYSTFLHPSLRQILLLALTGIVQCPFFFIESFNKCFYSFLSSSMR